MNEVQELPDASVIKTNIETEWRTVEEQEVKKRNNNRRAIAQHRAGSRIRGGVFCHGWLMIFPDFIWLPERKRKACNFSQRRSFFQCSSSVNLKPCLIYILVLLGFFFRIYRNWLSRMKESTSYRRCNSYNTSVLTWAINSVIDKLFWKKETHKVRGPC